MGSQLEDALRAALASASVPPGANESPARKRNANVRLRRRSRSESMASESNNDDPAQRMQAFQARMFEAGSDAASTTFVRAASTTDDVVKVQWKAKKSAPGQRNGVEDDEDTVPQLTRARVVSNGATTANAQSTSMRRAAKKKKRVHGKKPPVEVFETKVPSMAVPAKSVVVAKPIAAYKVTAVVPVGELSLASGQSFSGEDGNRAVGGEMTETTTNTPNRTESQLHSRSNGLSRKALPTRSKIPTLSTNVAAKEAATSILTSTRGKASSTKTAAPKPTKVNPKRREKEPNTTAKENNSEPTTSVQPGASKITPTSDQGEDEWDLDKLVKQTVLNATKRKASASDDEIDRNLDGDGMEEVHEDSDFVGKKFRDHQMHLFSQLIDEAARERWELVEVGRLVRIFAARWSHKKKKTARFLRRYCPELVSVDFLEGLNIPLASTQLLKIFERGSGSSVVVMNKVASAVENGNLSVHDEDVLGFVASMADSLTTNREVVEFLMPLLESLSKVKDVGILLKAICAHWHVDRTVSLVQEILLTPIFDDLDGQPDVILEDLPALEGRLDFPSCMDDEDADENGNLAGLIAGEESDLGEIGAHSEDEAEEKLGEILSDDADGDDSHAEDEVYEGETDSEEERQVKERFSPTTRRRSRFILDEADEDDGDGSDGEDSFVDDDDEDESESSGDSSDEDMSPKPQRKRLRRG